MQVHLDPARGGGDVLPVILGSPAFHKAHPDSAHLSQLVDRLKSMVNRLSEKGGELLVVEDLEAAAGGDLADSGRVEPEMGKVSKVDLLQESTRGGSCSSLIAQRLPSLRDTRRTPRLQRSTDGLPCQCAGGCFQLWSS